MIFCIDKNVQVLHVKYYNIHENENEKYLVQTRSQTNTSGTVFPKEPGIGIGVDPNLRP